MLAGGGGGGGMSSAEASALRAKVSLLQQQLNEARAEAGGDCSDWDGTLEAAEVALRAAAELLMAGDESVQADFDKWDRRIQGHPDHLAAVRSDCLQAALTGHPSDTAAAAGGQENHGLGGQPAGRVCGQVCYPSDLKDRAGPCVGVGGLVMEVSR